jgi:membrane protein required for colicin V production
LKIIDILLLILILIGGYAGYKKGLVIEILTFLAFIIAVLSAFKLMHSGVSFLSKDSEKSDGMLPYISFVIIFLIVFIAIFFLSKFLKKIVDYSLLGTFDNWAGAILGSCKMAFGISLFLWLTYHANIEIPKTVITDAVIYPQLISFAPNVVGWISNVIPFQDIFPLIKHTLQG